MLPSISRTCTLKTISLDWWCLPLADINISQQISKPHRFYFHAMDDAMWHCMMFSCRCVKTLIDVDFHLLMWPGWCMRPQPILPHQFPHSRNLCARLCWCRMPLVDVVESMPIRHVKCVHTFHGVVCYWLNFACPKCTSISSYYVTLVDYKFTRKCTHSTADASSNWLVLHSVSECPLLDAYIHVICLQAFANTSYRSLTYLALSTKALSNGCILLADVDIA